ncbi:hypothetical protein BP5796_13054 [Coleophoma crateriformis]|uniref:Uncharacterized protein n=1 Tax=Coleophoma crateriformis TaxID=565419 RepID=A0A3D8Q424_9HELO|nr:hypothetical protein BP5796_13054 [Coleophoma crateriformis]
MRWLPKKLLHARKSQEIPPDAAPPRLCHMVGSVPLSSSTEVLQHISAKLPQRLRRLPDGETGERREMVRLQKAIFSECPFVLRPDVLSPGNPDPPRTTNDKWIQKKQAIVLGPVKYDEYAIASYEVFRNLKAQGRIEADVRFQVCLPTPAQITCWLIDPQHQAQVEILYEAKLLSALRRIQDHIPRDELAIQWDMTAELALLDVGYGRFTPWFSGVFLGIGQRAARLAAAVDDGVEMGYHLCYGDKTNGHFVEPKDSLTLVKLANLLFDIIQRRIDWLHLPVPQNRTDFQYFAPMQNLYLRPETDLFLGLVYAGDKDGTNQRIKNAMRIIDEFGVSTECGLGKMPVDQLDGILDLMAAVTSPVERPSISIGTAF